MKKLGMTASEMIKLYNECGSFKECAKRVGWSIGTWAANWVDEGCEDLLDKNESCQTYSNEPELYSDNYTKVENMRVWTDGNIYGDFYNCPSDVNPCIVAKKDLVNKKYDNVNKNDDVEYQIAVISDTHFGSTYQQLSCLNRFIDICKERGIDTLLNAGDIIEGLSARMGHKNERFLHAIDDIEEYCAEVYPSGFKNNYFIIGNHCATLGRRMDGYDIGKNLVKDRKDLTYLPENPSLPNVIAVDGGARIQLFHGMSGCAKTRTGRTMNKSIEMRAMGQEFDIFIGGHCHSSSYIPNYMNKVLIGMPSFQAMTPYLASKGLVSECGGLILRYKIDRSGHPFNLIPEFIFDKQLGGIRRDDY